MDFKNPAAHITKVIRNLNHLGFEHLANTSTVKIPVGVYLQPAAPKHFCNLALFVPKRIFCWNTAHTLLWFIKVMYIGLISFAQLCKFIWCRTIPTVWSRRWSDRLQISKLKTCSGIWTVVSKAAHSLLHHCSQLCLWNPGIPLQGKAEYHTNKFSNKRDI